ncbi:YfcC family protein [Mycoplasma putrefaciens]|uniref:YfcC family protein n=1 Tax=Mycoplasma putrefaciens TaxID=2123 RepID=UPI003DA2DF8B
MNSHQTKTKSAPSNDFESKTIKKKRKFKMISSFSILLLIMFVLMLVSWILYWANVQTDIDKKIAFVDWKYDSTLKNVYDKWVQTKPNVQPGNNHEWIEFMDNLVSQGWTKNMKDSVWQNNSYVIGFDGVARFVGKARIQAIGIADVMYAPIKGFIDKADIIIFVLCIGAFIHMLVVSKALEGFSQAIVAKLKGKEVWAIIPLMTFFSIFGSVEGMAEESLGFYMIFIPLMLMAGFDVFTGVLIVMAGAGVGALASTVNPFLVPIVIDAINSKLPETATKMTVGNGLILRIIFWFILTSFTIAFTMIYAIRVKKNPSKSVTFSTLEGDKKFFLHNRVDQIKLDWRKKVSLVIFALTFVIMIIYLIGWDAIFNTSTMADHANWIKQHIPYLSAVIPGWGNGGLDVTAAMFLFSAIILGFINWMGEEKFLKVWFEGASDILSVSLIIGTAAGVGFILDQTNLQSLFVAGISNSIGGITNNIVKSLVLFILFIPLSFLIPSTTGFATAIFPLLTSSLMKNNQLDLYAATGALTAFQFASGIVNLITPTSGVVMGAVSISRVGYSRYLKGIMPLVGCLTVLSILLIVLTGILPISIVG